METYSGKYELGGVSPTQITRVWNIRISTLANILHHRVIHLTDDLKPALRNKYILKELFQTNLGKK
jgi:hypothetical protein